MKDIYQKRLSYVRQAMVKHGLDTFIVLIEENRRYLSGFTGEDTQFDESAGALLVSANKQVLVTDSRFDLQAKQEAPDYEIVLYKEGLAKEFAHLVRRLNPKHIGFESARLTYAQYRKISESLSEAGLTVELVETENIVESLRIIKAPEEIAAIREALQLAESVFVDVVKTLKPGLMEVEVAWAMEKRLREAGAEGLSFPTIVASGPNSALPHAIAGNRRMRPDEPVLFDWGVRLRGYCSDISRTIVFGKPDETFKKIFQTVYEAQQLAIEAIKPGVSTKEVDRAARSHIEKKGFKERFGHGLGHGVGLAIHEPPRLSPLVDKILEAGMVCTVEPGIYIPDWGGIRLENMVVVTNEGVEVLNKLGVNDIEIGA